ncbi:hypothetical protein A0O34_06400 [Chryseobacterium glaciei]|uniref:DUF3300 domain-containing protein n=1 Tax=Chryseobacterium glaciei TaxID=1685010 RepID=A0A172XTK2_9FLAO|nr:hypothetical protein [Chryseobacterium glaciei]ANF50162.1 hypothetical protein A0O34_06400 [Chryseobacterium glaciei]
MKKIFLGFALSLATLSFAQQYPNNGYGNGNDGYNNGYGNNGYENNNYGSNDGYYSNEDDQNYFPDDYYYNYPQDYYPTDYYQNNYNDYRSSIVNVNWNVFFNQNRLNRWQIDQILRLNNLYVSFSTWDNYYRYNPDRWYYDRFYALQRIMGPQIFVSFQNNYYRGASPVVYFQTYRRTHYASICRPMPRYRNVNINIYRVDRAKFRGNNNPSFNIARTSQRENNGFRGGSGRDNNNSGFHNRPNNNSGGFRGSGNNGTRNNGGFRAGTENTGGTRNTGGFRNDVRTEPSAPRENTGGFRGNAGNSGGNRSSGGFRTETRRESSAPRESNGGFRQQRSESSAPRQGNNGGGNRSASGGFRLTSN